jgi:hypothetical protein
MLENKFGELFEESQVPPEPQHFPAQPTPSQFGPFVSASQIYQAAFEQALRDRQLDMLFNSEHYGDHGSGI